MEESKKVVEEALNGFSPVSSTPVFWKSRKRSGMFCLLLHHIFFFPSVNGKNLDQPRNSNNGKTTEPEEAMEEEAINDVKEEVEESNTSTPILSQKRKALFEPLEPITTQNNLRPSNESLLPPPDFDLASYPKGWLVGKKRKLVNVDVVESMRRIAVQEMNRKDREIDGLNEQLEEDARVLEHLQVQLLEERSKRGDVERQNTMLQNQITMLMDMLQENDPVDDEDPEEP